MDPFAPRRNLAAEEIHIRMGSGEWRDERDMALWNHWECGGFRLYPNAEIPPKLLSDSEPNEWLPKEQWSDELKGSIAIWERGLSGLDKGASEGLLDHPHEPDPEEE